MQSVMARMTTLTLGYRTAALRTVSQVQVSFVAENVTRNGQIITPSIIVPMGVPIMLTTDRRSPPSNALDGQDISTEDGRRAMAQAANQRIAVPMRLYDTHLLEAHRTALENAQNGANRP